MAELASDGSFQRRWAEIMAAPDPWERLIRADAEAQRQLAEWDAEDAATRPALRLVTS